MKAFWLLSVLGASSVEAHVRQRFFLPNVADSAQEGQESIVGWPKNSTIKLSMHSYAGNIGTGGTATAIGVSTAAALVGTDLLQWTSSSNLFGSLTPAFSLDLASGNPYLTSNTCETTASGDLDGVNNILFKTKRGSSCSGSIPSGVIGLTRILYRTTDGVIVEGDIQFDDQTYLFKTSGANDLISSPKQINLHDVVTHEVGHFWGLDHSASRTATMLFAVAENMQTTKTDDEMGLFSLYPPSNLSSQTGALKASIRKDGTLAFGAAAFLLHARTLKVSAHEMSDPNGAVHFCALPPGPHVAYATRYKPYGTNISEYYSGTGDGSTNQGSYGCYNPTCGLMDQDLGRTWWADAPADGSGGKKLRVIKIPQGGTAQYLNFEGTSADQALTAISVTTSLPLDEPRVTRITSTTVPLAGVTPLVGATQDWTVVAPTSGDFRVRTAALGIYSRLQLSLAVYDGATNAVSGCTLYAATVNVASDPWADCVGLTSGVTYRVRVTGNGVACNLVSGNSLGCVTSGVEAASTPETYYMITAYESSNENSTNFTGATTESSNGAGGTFSGIPACSSRSDAVRIVRASTETSSSSSSKKDTGKCCGMIRQIPGGPSGPGSYLLAVLTSPILWFGLWWKFRRRRKNVLSIEGQ